MEIKKTPKANLENKNNGNSDWFSSSPWNYVHCIQWSKNEIKVYDDAIQGEFVEDEEMIEVTFRDAPHHHRHLSKKPF